VDEAKTRLMVDLSSAREGKVTVDLNRATLNPELPRRLKTVRMSPVRLEARLEQLARRRLPVAASLAGTPALGYTTKSSVSPDHVDVTGPASTVSTLENVSTRRIDVDGLSAPLERMSVVEPAGDFVTIVPDRVLVDVWFEEVTITRNFKRVPITLRNGEGARITPAEVSVTVRGPEAVLHDWKLPDGAVFVDAGGLGPGTHDVPVQVDLPAPLVVTARRPESVRVVVEATREQGGA
jgi:YbbR domain-containing protein